MTFSDIFKSSFLESVTEFSPLDVLLGMVVVLVVGLFIFVIYKFKLLLFSLFLYLSFISINSLTTATSF